MPCYGHFYIFAVHFRKFFVMESYEAFSLPISGLDDGIHHYRFEVGEDFFSGFDQSPIEGGDIAIELELDKRPDMLVMWFDISGVMNAACDRCLAPIRLPISGRYRLIGKIGEAEEEADVFYFSPDATKLNVAKYIYEYCCLSVPLKKTYDCMSEAERPCDDEVLAEQERSEEEKGDPVWDQLKDLNFDN